MDWLLLADVCRLDTAICTVSDRPTFLKVIRCVQTKLELRLSKYYYSQEITEQCLLWLTVRQINLDKFSISCARIPDTSLFLDTCSSLLMQQPHLHRLQIEGVRLDPGAAVSLSFAVSNMIHLSSLELSRNQIGDVEAGALSVAFSKLANLKLIDFKGNNIGEEGAASLGKALSNWT